MRTPAPFRRALLKCAFFAQLLAASGAVAQSVTAMYLESASAQNVGTASGVVDARAPAWTFTAHHDESRRIWIHAQAADGEQYSIGFGGPLDAPLGSAPTSTHSGLALGRPRGWSCYSLPGTADS